MKALLFVGMTTCLAAVGTATHQQTGIEPGDGLRMSIAPDESAWPGQVLVNALTGEVSMATAMVHSNP